MEKRKGVELIFSKNSEHGVIIGLVQLERQIIIVTEKGLYKLMADGETVKRLKLKLEEE